VASASTESRIGVVSSPDSKRFTREEAERLVGRRMRALAPYAYLPPGTTGAVVGAEEVSPDGYELVVEFNVARQVRDWFTRSEFAEFLTEA
jgi:hypothetical protein